MCRGVVSIDMCFSQEEGLNTRTLHGTLFLFCTDGYGFQEPRVQMVRGYFTLARLEHGWFRRNSVCCGPVYGPSLSLRFGYGAVYDSRLSLRVGFGPVCTQHLWSRTATSPMPSTLGMLSTNSSIFPGLFSVTIFEVGNIYHGIYHGNTRYFLDGNRPLWYMPPWYSAPTVMLGVFWVVIGHSGTCYRGIQPPR